MKNRKKVLAALLAGVMTLSMGTTVFAAEAEDGYALKATNTEAKSPDNDLVIAIEGSVSSMDPANIPDTNAISATRGCYEMLVAFDENQEIQGQLASPMRFPRIPSPIHSISVKVLSLQMEQTLMRQQ